MIFSRLFKKKSGNVAKERLAAVLISDRARCAPDTLANIQCDISHALEKYMEINLNAIDFKIVSKEDVYKRQLQHCRCLSDRADDKNLQRINRCAL